MLYGVSSNRPPDSLCKRLDGNASIPQIKQRGMKLDNLTNAGTAERTGVSFCKQPTCNTVYIVVIAKRRLVNNVQLQLFYPYGVVYASTATERNIVHRKCGVRPRYLGFVRNSHMW